jgi:cytochrome d ubiquinol oxidase subunit II
MFSFLDYSGLQHYWWILVSLLGALLVFLLFVQGGQSLIYTLASNEKEKTMLLNSTGRKWEITFTTLVTFGGAFFASFPLFYSTSFGGAYWVWMAILFAFILQAVSYEFRSKANNFLGHKTFEAFLFLNGVLGSLLLGLRFLPFLREQNFRLIKPIFWIYLHQKCRLFLPGKHLSTDWRHFGQPKIWHLFRISV